MPRIEFKGKRFVESHHLSVPYHQLIPDEDASLTDNISLNDNLIIHGDNLLALKALLPLYQGKVKCIYIDPPYNTGNEGWQYNDNVNSPMIQEWLKENKPVDKEDLTRHDKWLCMMMPRLKLLRELLRDDGVIFVSIDDNEVYSLKSLMDEIFGEDNFINMVTVKTKPSSGASGGGEDLRLKKNVEFLLIYVRNKENQTPALDLQTSGETVDLLEHIRQMKEDKVSWKYTRVMLSDGNPQHIGNTQDAKGEDIKVYEHSNYEIVPIGELISKKQKELDISFEDAEKIIHRQYLAQIFRDTNAQSSIRTRVADFVGQKKGLFSIEYIPRSGRNKGKLTTVYYIGEKKDQIAWLSDVTRVENDEMFFITKVGTLWDKFNWNNVTKEGNMPFPNGKKPIALINRILSMATNPYDGDIVLDCFAGSGSTAHAVFHANASDEDNGNRQFILIEEQNAYEITSRRVRNVIEKELQTSNISFTFSFFHVGNPINVQSMLFGEDKDLPQYVELARYLFYTTTGEEFVPSKMNETEQYIGESRNYHVYLLYEPRTEALQTIGLTLSKAESTRNKHANKTVIVYAPICFVDGETLSDLNIEFVRLPFGIYRFPSG